MFVWFFLMFSHLVVLTQHSKCKDNKCVGTEMTPISRNWIGAFTPKRFRFTAYERALLLIERS